MKEACGNCRYWREQRKSSDVGNCCIDSPKILTIPTKFGVEIVGAWPGSQRTAWCGKFTALTEADVAQRAEDDAISEAAARNGSGLVIS